MLRPVGVLPEEGSPSFNPDVCPGSLHREPGLFVSLRIEAELLADADILAVAAESGWMRRCSATCEGWTPNASHRIGLNPCLEGGRLRRSDAPHAQVCLSASTSHTKRRSLA